MLLGVVEILLHCTQNYFRSSRGGFFIIGVVLYLLFIAVYVNQSVTLCQMCLVYIKYYRLHTLIMRRDIKQVRLLAF